LEVNNPFLTGSFLSKEKKYRLIKEKSDGQLENDGSQYLVCRCSFSF